MEFIRGENNLKPHHRGCVATIGNFDGIHLGHQAVLAQLAKKSQELDLPSLVVSFEPLPREYFAAHPSPARICRFREKVLALQKCGVHRLLCLRFNNALATMPPDRFIERILVQGLRLHHLVVGDDFHFGKNRQGNFAMLQRAGQMYNFSVANTETYVLDKERVSSTRVREALQAGVLEEAARLLGRPYCMIGRVAHGDKRGRTLGFPTANIPLRRMPPLSGVFSVKILGLDHPLNGIANLGKRPTVKGIKPQLEIHLFNFNQDIYGQRLEVEFLNKIRDEIRFDSIDALKAQIARDVAQSAAYFSNQKHSPTSTKQREQL